MGRNACRVLVFSAAATAVAGLVGCGSVKDSGFTDAATGDAGLDADESGEATVVTQAVLFGGTVGEAVGDIDVVSMSASNTLIEAKKTDASGNVTIKVVPGGSVTAIYKHTIDMGADLITWVGVKPGDTLNFSSRSAQAPQGTPNTSLGSQTFSWPTQGGVTQYIVSTSTTANGAGSASTSLVMQENQLWNVNSPFGGTFFQVPRKDPQDVLFLALTGNMLSHFNTRQNVTFSAGANVAIGGWAPAVAASVNMTGLPPEITGVSGQFSTVLDGMTEHSFLQGFNGQPTGGAFTGNFMWAPVGDRTLAYASFNRQNFQSIRLIDSLTSNAVSQTIASPTLPPWVQGQVAVSTALREATWFPVPTAASAHDGQMLRVGWNHVVSAVNHPHAWHFILPPGQTSITFPKLPAAFEDHLPAPQDGLNALQLRLFDISTAANYDAVRALPSRNVMCLECGLRSGDFQRVVISGQ
ncbi:MAG: hypothetical protein M3680_28125 [Myxococcota bacterium]|nr:hypothetical protein [Myxococcota bacterium]